MSYFKIRGEHLTVRTPSIVAQWSNFADRRDPVAVDTHLADDYDENAQGVTVRDQLVLNTYHAPGKSKPNPQDLGISASARGFGGPEDLHLNRHSLAPADPRDRRAPV
jgi:hypothetical protein